MSFCHLFSVIRHKKLLKKYLPLLDQINGLEKIPGLGG